MCTSTQTALKSKASVRSIGEGRMSWISDMISPFVFVVLLLSVICVGVQACNCSLQATIQVSTLDGGSRK